MTSQFDAPFFFQQKMYFHNQQILTQKNDLSTYDFSGQQQQKQNVEL